MPEQEREVPRFLTAEDFFQDSEESMVFEEVFQALEEEASQSILDEAELRRQKDWSVLAHQVVGAEHLVNGS